jgi:hypothetical protein
MIKGRIIFQPEVQALTEKLWTEICPAIAMHRCWYFLVTHISVK